MRLFGSGLRKLVRRPAPWLPPGLLLGLLGLILAAVVAPANDRRADPDGGNALLLLTFPLAYGFVLGFILGLGGLFAVIYGAAVAGSEWGWGTLKNAVARGESRSRYVVATFAGVALLTGIGLLVAFAAGVALAVVGANLAGVSTAGLRGPGRLPPPSPRAPGPARPLRGAAPGPRRRREPCPTGAPRYAPRIGRHADLHAGRHQRHREVARPRRPGRDRGPDHPGQHVPPLPPPRPRAHRPPRRTAPFHGLGPAHPPRPGRLPGREPGRPARHRRRGGHLPQPPRRFAAPLPTGALDRRPGGPGPRHRRRLRST